nr:L478 [uncultured bacterium]
MGFVSITVGSMTIRGTSSRTRDSVASAITTRTGESTAQIFAVVDRCAISKGLV